MNYQAVFESAQSLSAADRAMLISALTGLGDILSEKTPSPRLEELLNKQACCPHCGEKHYYRYGKDKGSQRFKCNECHRTFTEYTGTWQEGLHKKVLVDQYILMMSEQKSLDKISAALHINKKTAFDWRHKILETFNQDEGDSFSGIVESDETFFEDSEKGNRHLDRPGRKRGTDPKKRGISDDKATVIVTADRKNGLNMTYCGHGRLTKKEIVESLNKPLPPNTILCSDGHVSYKGYAIDNHLKHVVLRADLKQHIKKGGFHIQHINSLHNRLKKWIDNVFWGVSTKYLQNYLNWFKVKETILKTAQDQAADLFKLSMEKIKGKSEKVQIYNAVFN
jgi:transposase-like protein